MNYRRKMLCWLVSVCVIALMSFGFPLHAQTALTASSPNEIAKYEVYEITFDWQSAGYANVWQDVRLDVTFTAPDGSTTQIGGFYYEADTWKARFAPNQSGEWTWTATLDDGSSIENAAGTVRVTDSDAPGWVRNDPVNMARFTFEDGTPYHAIGLSDCLQDVNENGYPLDDFGIDGVVRPPGVHLLGNFTTMDDYFRIYSEAGFNLFRWSVDNCGFTLYDRISPEGNTYLEVNGKWGDELIQTARRYGMRVYLTIFGFDPPYLNDAENSENLAAVHRALDYVVNRYGAYADIWELMNEARPRRNAGDTWFDGVIPHLREIDPYDHLISTNWERPDLQSIDIISPHVYTNESQFEVDTILIAEVDRLTRRERNNPRPVVFGENGNELQNWDEGSAARMRIRSWTAFFNDATLIFWNTSFAKDYRDSRGASNLYLGVEERGYIRALQDFTAQVGAGVQSVAVTVSGAPVRAYAINAQDTFALYAINAENHSDATTGAQFSVDLPFAGAGGWIDPSTGDVLSTIELGAGDQTVSAPDFVADIALIVTP